MLHDTQTVRNTINIDRRHSYQVGERIQLSRDLVSRSGLFLEQTMDSINLGNAAVAACLSTCRHGKIHRKKWNKACIDCATSYAIQVWGLRYLLRRNGLIKFLHKIAQLRANWTDLASKTRKWSYSDNLVCPKAYFEKIFFAWIKREIPQHA